MFDPEEFLSLAERLYSEPSSEGDLRSAFSGSYYALFLKTRQRFDKKGVQHLALWNAVRQGNLELATTGNRMRGLRNAADYADDMPSLQSDAAWCVKSARRVWGEAF